jgi:outer membrane protein OmpA-like peptidoglycan-associated protein
LTGIYAFFIVGFAITLTLFYTSRCQTSSHSENQDTDILKPEDSSDNLQIVTKKIDINKGQPENKFEASKSDDDASDKNIDSQTSPGEAINPSVNPVRSQPHLKSSKQKAVIYFSTESTGLTDKALEKLKTIYLFLLKYPDEELIIEGYGDSSKTNRYNENLSKLRATIIEPYFIKRGISNSRIKTFWMGSEDPAEINMIQEGENKTHQVEVKFKLGSRYDQNN